MAGEHLTRKSCRQEAKLSGMLKGQLGYPTQGKVPTTMRLWARRLPVVLGRPHRPRGALSLLAGKLAAHGCRRRAGLKTAVDKGLRQASPELGPVPPRSPCPQVGAMGWWTRPGREARDAHSPICPMNSILMPWCSSRLLGFLSARLTFPETVSPS